MSEENKEVVETTQGNDAEVKQDAKTETKTEVEFTKEQNAKIEEIVAKRTEKALEKANKEAEAKRLEAERLAKLSKEEAIAEREKAFAVKEAKFNALNKLSEEGLSNKFVDMVADTDNDKMLENIAELKSYINSQVEKNVQSKLASSPKQAIANNKPAEAEDPFLKGFRNSKY